MIWLIVIGLVVFGISIFLYMDYREDNPKPKKKAKKKKKKQTQQVRYYVPLKPGEVAPIAWQANTVSLAQLFGASPMIDFICGNCRNETMTRVMMNTVGYTGGIPISCPYCGVVNRLPIRRV